MFVKSEKLTEEKLSTTKLSIGRSISIIKPTVFSIQGIVKFITSTPNYNRIEVDINKSVSCVILVNKALGIVTSSNVTRYFNDSSIRDDFDFITVTANAAEAILNLSTLEYNKKEKVETLVNTPIASGDIILVRGEQHKVLAVSSDNKMMVEHMIRGNSFVISHKDVSMMSVVSEASWLES